MNHERNSDGLAPDVIQAEFEENFAPWVRELDLTVGDSSAEHVTLTMRPGARLNRHGDIVSGQALMAAADTAMVLAVWSACGEAFPCPTVDMTTSFLKPAVNVDLRVTARIVRQGRRLAFARAEIAGSRDGKLVVTASGTYALPG